MVNYSDANWYGWNGGECPVHPETMVEVTSGSCQTSGKASDFTWHHNCYGPIIAFRVIKEHREPREPRDLWLTMCPVDGYKVRFREPDERHPYAAHAFKVREVIE